MKESETALLTSEYGLAINRSVQQKLAYLLPKIQMEMFLSFAVIYRPCMSFRMILSDLAKYSMPGSIATAELLVSSPPLHLTPFWGVTVGILSYRLVRTKPAVSVPSALSTTALSETAVLKVYSDLLMAMDLFLHCDWYTGRWWVGSAVTFGTITRRGILI